MVLHVDPWFCQSQITVIRGLANAIALLVFCMDMVTVTMWMEVDLVWRIWGFLLSHGWWIMVWCGDVFVVRGDVMVEVVVFLLVNVVAALRIFWVGIVVVVC
ncbi:Hypothetical predicted protein [Olea europaea subsp. europaea]|uniref:Transmembrane protein n=1 Tax=Olea europaea subsp. europaea TaxID=158383 RepID=A0A8S0SP82_OLEEU|nr:Hypothetical predicted protein [Olea europaea subsp. europaea]